MPVLSFSFPSSISLSLSLSRCGVVAAPACCSQGSHSGQPVLVLFSPCVTSEALSSGFCHRMIGSIAASLISIVCTGPVSSVLEEALLDDWHAKE